MLLNNKQLPGIDHTAQLEQLFRENYEGMLYTATAYFSANAAPGSSVHHLAEDAVQETFITAWEKCSDLLSSSSPKGWLYKTLKNIAKNIVRTEWTLCRHFAQIPEGIEIASSENVYFLPELQTLITEDEYLLLMRLYLGKNTYQDISQETGVSEAALAMRVRRIKLKLQKQY